MFSRSCASLARRGFSSRSGDGVVILSAARTPIGTFQGEFASLKAPELGAIAGKAALSRAGVQLEDVNEALWGNVISAGIGQAPARQASIGAGLPWSVSCTTVNKVCSSGLKATMLGAQSIMSGQNNVVLAGGFESMTHVPFYMDNARSGLRLGHGQVTDGILKDGLWDAFDDHHMGMCAEECAESFNLGRDAQDAYAMESYRRSIEATKNGWFKEEIVPVSIPQRGGAPDLVIDEDMEIRRYKAERVATAKPAFKKGGTVTAVNASSLNDGGAALVIASESWARERGLKPMARIVGMGDAAQKPVRFTTAPSLAIPIALERAGITLDQVSAFEINEAFSVVSLVNNQLLGLDPAKVNMHGGAVSLGHPIGCSGARILVTLLHVLKRTGGQYGIAAICNGGGGASSLVVEQL